MARAARLHQRLQIAEAHGHLVRPDLADLRHAEPDQEARQRRLVARQRRCRRPRSRRSFRPCARARPACSTVRSNRSATSATSPLSAPAARRARARSSPCSSRRACRRTRSSARAARDSRSCWGRRARPAPPARTSGVPHDGQTVGSTTGYAIGAALDDGDDVGDDLARLLQQHAIADGHVEPLDLVVVEERGALDRRARQLDRLEVAERRDGAGAPDIMLDLQ